MGNGGGQPRKRLSKGGISVLIKKHKSYVPDEKKLQDVKLLPTKCKPRRYAFCNTTQEPHSTQWMCEKRNVRLCMLQKDIKRF
ncbi:hypothetical protein NPIL_385791 [Nephila pilipes]|uniref:Uncharacterized protein n=1 Tax=Nephila pilipes TaxID=299642 RepID=A0A8X6U0Q6_NEPPI|nr:hypothetical protein NPIL_385791 [Nephila pilipes]